MHDRNISATVTAAYVLWTLGGSIILLSLFIAVPIAPVGIFVSGAAMVVHIRSFFICLAQRELEAFELGRESVRPIR